MRIYVASSWRNQLQPDVVVALRHSGHQVYDFKNPPNRSGFAWRDIAPDWEQWTLRRYIEALEHPDAVAGFAEDMNALKGAECCVLVMPCGRSSHLELGWAVGAGKRTYILQVAAAEPELMYKMADGIVTSVEALLEALQKVAA